MLDNTELINTLEETKTKAFEVSEKLKLGAKTSRDIERLRDGYRPAAKRGAILFFVLAEMSTVNSMYQYSLASYLEVFEYSLRKATADANLEKRLTNIMHTLTMNVYNYGCTGIFEKHKLLFSFQITVKLEQDRKNVTQEELDFFIKVSFSSDLFDSFLFNNFLFKFVMYFRVTSRWKRAKERSPMSGYTIRLGRIVFDWLTSSQHCLAI